jgi:predicted ATPase
LITHLHIENFRCLRDVTIDLAPFVVLIGPNDSGKSSILDAISLLGRTVHGALSESFGGGSAAFDSLLSRAHGSQRMALVARGREPREFTYHLELERGPRLHRESLLAGGGLALSVDGAKGQVSTSALLPAGASAGGALSGAAVKLHDDSTALRSALASHAEGAPDLVKIASAFGSSAKYKFDAQALRRPAPPEPAPSLSPSGDNLPAVLDALLTGPSRGAVQALETSLREVTPTLSCISLRTVVRASGHIVKALEFTLSGGGDGKGVTAIPAEHASEGALLMTAFLALAYGQGPEILLIEEPSAGLHPARVRKVVELLRQISTGEVGERPRQVIVATHSPTLLNYVKPAEVRVVRRDPEKGTSVTPMLDIPNIKHLMVGFQLGELWASLSEDGLLPGTS